MPSMKVAYAHVPMPAKRHFNKVMKTNAGIFKLAPTLPIMTLLMLMHTALRPLVIIVVLPK